MKRLSIVCVLAGLVSCSQRLVSTQILPPGLPVELPTSSIGPIATTQPRHAEDANRIFRVDGRDDREIVYRDNGRSDAPLTLLFLHGIGSSIVAWRDVAPKFSDRYRVIQLDLLGHGGSDKPVEFGYGMSGQGEVVRKFIAANGLKNLIIVGHSYGGGVALEAALLYLESGNPWINTAADGRTPIVRGLVVINAPALDFPKPSLLSLMNGTSVSFLEALFSTDRRARLILEVAFWNRAKIPADLEAEYARIFRDPRTTDVYLWIADKELFKELAARKDRESRYGAIACPVLVLWGEHDRVVPRDVFDRLFRILPDAQCDLMPDCGHTPVEERPTETAERIAKFLDDRILTSPMRVAALPYPFTASGGGAAAARP